MNRTESLKKILPSTKLDSVASQLRILNLLNDWPFVTTKNKNAINNFSLKNRIDIIGLIKLQLKILIGKLHIKKHMNII